MEQKDYKLTMTIDFQGRDDIEARLLVNGAFRQIVDEIEMIYGSEVKLQRIFKDKPPEKVEL